MGKTLFDKIWDGHVIKDLGNGFVLLHIDRLLLHDLSGARALREAVDKGYAPAQPRLVYGTPDHAISTAPGRTEDTFPPGATLIRGDSHTCTHGGVGALAFGVGSSELVHALATQTMVQRKPKRFRANFEGKLQPGVTPKDMIL